MLRNEFLVSDMSGNSFLLHTKYQTGLTIRSNASKVYSEKILYQKCAKDIDVCMGQDQNTYILAQSTTGNILKIIHRDQVWHKDDLLIPKLPQYYEKRLRAIPHSGGVTCFYNIKNDPQHLLCTQDMLNSGAQPGVISPILDAHTFDLCKCSQTHAAAVLVNPNGLLGMVFFHLAQSKCSKFIALFEGKGITYLAARYTNRKLHIVFVKAQSLFYIAVDVNTRITDNIYDVGPVQEGSDISIGISKNDLKIFIISPQQVEVNTFDFQTKERTCNSYERPREEIINLNLIYPNDSLQYPAVFQNGQYQSLMNVFTQADPKLQNTDINQRILALTQEIEELRKQMK